MKQAGFPFKSEHPIRVLSSTTSGKPPSGVLHRDLRQIVLLALPDLTPPKADPGHAVGNHAIILCDGLTVTLAHLRQGSVQVAKGDVLAPGDPIGRSAIPATPPSRICTSTPPKPGPAGPCKSASMAGFRCATVSFGVDRPQRQIARFRCCNCVTLRAHLPALTPLLYSHGMSGPAADNRGCSE